MLTLIIIIYKIGHFGFLKVASTFPKRLFYFIYVGRNGEEGILSISYHSSIYISYIFFSFNPSFTIFIILIYTIKTISWILNTEQCEKFIKTKELLKSTKKGSKVLCSFNIYKESRISKQKFAAKRIQKK